MKARARWDLDIDTQDKANGAALENTKVDGTTKRYTAAHGKRQRAPQKCPLSRHALPQAANRRDL